MYENDYAQTWDRLLADLNVAPLKSISQAAQDLYVLGSPQSPMRALLVAVARQLTLSTGTGGSSMSGREIDERYSALREMVGSGPGSPIDQVLRSFNDLQQQLAKATAAAAGTGVLVGLGDPCPALRAEALRQPEPLGRWMTTLATSGAVLRGGGVRP